jgi:hypothetical protein
MLSRQLFVPYPQTMRMRSWFPPFANCAKDGAPTALVMPARSKAWATRHLGFFLNPLPDLLHVPRLGMRLAHAESQCQLALQLGVGEKKIAATVQAIHDGLIRGVAALVSEAH